MIRFSILSSGLWKTHQFVWDSLLDHDRLEWQQTLDDLENALDVAYQDVLKGFDSIWCVKSLIVTQSNLVVTWKVRPWMRIPSRVPSICNGFMMLLYFPFAIEFFLLNFFAQKTPKKLYKYHDHTLFMSPTFVSNIGIWLILCTVYNGTDLQYFLYYFRAPWPTDSGAISWLMLCPSINLASGNCCMQ